MRVPTTVHDADGLLLTVQRAWPHDDGRLTVEAVEESGRVRAGRISPDGTVAMASFAEDSALPDLVAAAGAGEVLVHRYRKRAVVRQEAAFLKVLPMAKVADVADRHRTAADLTRDADIRVPHVIGVDGGTLTLSVVDGASLHDLGRADSSPGGEPVDDAWSSWAERWPAFVRAAGGPAAVVPSYGPEDEARTLAVWVARGLHSSALQPEAERLETAAERARTLLLDGTPQRPGLAHRDLHDKQLFVAPASGADRGAVGLIDCDTLALAEPALDLANLLVHLEFRQAQGLLGARARASGEQAILGVIEELGIPTDRVAAYALSTRLRLACVYAFRPRWQELALEWLRAA